MARKLSPLTAQVVLDLNKWTAGLKQMDRDAKAITSSLKSVADTTKYWGVAFTAAGTAVGGSLLALSKKAADFGDSLFDASKKTGISAQALAGFKLLADQSGTSFETLSKGVGILSKNIVAAASGSKDQAQIFKALGIAVKDASGNLRNASDIMPEIADRLSKIEDGSLKAATAQKLFGKAGAELIPLLDEGAEGFRKAQQNAAKYGGDIQKIAALGNDFNDTLAESRAAMQGFANAIGVALLPKLTELVKTGNEWIATAARWTSMHPELTKAIAGTAAVLFAGGGLLLGLQGLALILPKVLPLLAKLAATMETISVLRGVKTFQDFSTGIDLIGESSITGRLGLIGLAAGAGYAVGQLANYLIELSGYQKQVDQVINTLTRFSGLGFLSTNPATAMGDTAAAAKANAALEAEAKRRGMTTEQLRAASVKAWQAQQQLNASQKQGAQTSSDLEARMQKLLGAFDTSASKADNEAKALQELYESMSAALTPADNLDEELTKLQKLHFSNSEIVSVYAEKISEAVKVQKEHGFAISKNIEQLDLQAEALLRTKAAEEAVNEAIKLRKKSIETVSVDMPEILPTESVLTKGIQNLQAQREALKENAAAAVQMANAGYSASQIEEALGVNLTEVSKRAQQLGVQLDPVTRKALQQAAAAQNLQESWSDAFAKISDDLVDMIVDFDFSFKRLANIAKDTAKSLLRSFLDGFLAPFKAKLAELGAEAATAISGISYGRGGQSQTGGGGILSGILGGGNNGILGGLLGGNTQGGPMSEQLPSGISGGFGRQQPSGLSLKLNPISMGFGIANDAVSLYNNTFGKIGQGRRAANEIVKSQNAFQSTVENILADSGLSSTNKLKLIDNLFSAFQTNAATFGGNDPNNQKVVNQAFATLAPWITAVRGDLLKQGAGDIAAGGGAVFNITLNTTVNASQRLDAITVRDEIIPEITTTLQTGVRGVLQEWSRLLNNETAPGNPASVSI